MTEHFAPDAHQTPEAIISVDTMARPADAVPEVDRDRAAPVVDVIDPLPLEKDRAIRLRRMKFIATACLAVAGGVFILTYLVGWKGQAVLFVRAASEAGMVGGLADWFAVTALFRRPLGLPIPHTALIPEKKDAFASTLGQFITGHFFTQDAIRSQLTSADLIRKAGLWTTSGDNAQLLATRLSAATGTVLESVRGSQLAGPALELVEGMIAKEPLTPQVGRLLEDWHTAGGHDPLVQLAIRRARLAVKANEKGWASWIQKFVEDKGAIAWLVMDNRKARMAVRDICDQLGAAEFDPQHQIRKRLDEALSELIEDLATNEITAARLDKMVREWLVRPETTERIAPLLDSGLEALRNALSDPSSPMVQGVSESLRELGTRLVEDAEFRSRAEEWLTTVVLNLAEEHANEFTHLIEAEVSRWNGKETSRRIELAAGRDLQFIRINGTVVGAMAGIVIYAISLTFS